MLVPGPTPDTWYGIISLVVPSLGALQCPRIYTVVATPSHQHTNINSPVSTWPGIRRDTFMSHCLILQNFIQYNIAIMGMFLCLPSFVWGRNYHLSSKQQLKFLSFQNCMSWKIHNECYMLHLILERLKLPASADMPSLRMLWNLDLITFVIERNWIINWSLTRLWL